MSNPYTIWFDDSPVSLYNYLARQFAKDGADDEIDDICVFEQYVYVYFNATLIRDSDDDENFWQWIGIQFKNEQDMIMFILKVSDV